jgi:hypothetical protein
VPPVSAVRYVSFDTESLDAVPLPIRTEDASLKPGARLEVEVGGRWATIDGHRQRIEGHWVKCEVVAERGRDLVVKLLKASGVRRTPKA